jgi:branched-chain amino acid transport system substrate-binding protein
MRALTRRMALAAAVLAIAGCSGVGPGAGDAGPLELRIGVLAPLSGPNAAAGKEALRGAQLAAELITDGALDESALGAFPRGLRVTIVAGNTEDDPEEGAKQAARLVAEEGVVALVGAGTPAVMDTASQRAERLEVPFVGVDANADFLTERGLAWFFRTSPTARGMAESLYSVLLQEAGGGGAAPRTVAVLYQDDPEARAAAALLGELAGEGGFELGVNIMVSSNADLDGAVAQTLAASPAAVFLVADTPAGARRLIELFRRAGSDPPAVLGFGAGFGDATFQASGRDAAGLLYTTSWSPRVADRNPAARLVTRTYQERQHQSMTEPAAGAFTAVQVLAQAVGRAGVTTPAALRASLLGLDIPGRSTIMPWEGIRFDATGQNTRATGVVHQRFRDGTRVVFPSGVRDGAALPPDQAG